MDGWMMVAAYVGGAGVLALIANRSKFLRRRAGWGAFGEKNRPDGFEGAQAAVLASLGTGRAAMDVGDWRVFRPSFGVRALPFALGAAITYHFLYPEQTPGFQTVPTPPEMYAAMMLAVAASCAYVLRARVSTNGDGLRVRGLLTDKRYDLHNLREVEEDGVHSYRLSFIGGKTVEILKTVEGAAELRHMLRTRLERNRDARVTGS
ncbi:hypothetical protein [Gymnodinialimonas sp.]